MRKSKNSKASPLFRFVFLFCLILFLVIYILIHTLLPYPNRLPYQPITHHLAKESSLRTDWFYTEGPFLENQAENSFNAIDPAKARGVSVIPVLEPHTPKGLFHFGFGFDNSRLNLIRGFLVGNSSPAVIEKRKDYPKDVVLSDNTAKNRLRVQYFLFPSRHSESHQCHLVLKDETNKILASNTLKTPSKDALKEPSWFSSLWNSNYFPDLQPPDTLTHEFSVSLAAPPAKLIAEIYDENQTKTPEQNQKLGEHNVTNDDCVAALGDFSFESAIKTPLKRRGVIFILVDTLRSETAYDSNLMPNLNQFAQKEATKFNEHRSQANMTVPSVSSFMSSRYGRELGSVAFSYSSDDETRRKFYATQIPLMPRVMEKLGYRVGGIGWLSLFSEALEGGVDFGFHNAIISENFLYEAREITEHMGNWLQNYGDAPFFLYVHYNTMHGPYRPPLKDIHLSHLISHPFGLAQRQELYNGLGRYWDQEFSHIIQKLKDLGIYDQVDIVITADHGAQFHPESWDYLSGIHPETRGAYADKGHSLLDEELHVPLFIHLANAPQSYGEVVNTPTTHVDLFPTLYDLAGGSSPDFRWRGMDWLPALTKQGHQNFETLLRKRESIYFDAHRYSGVLFWDNNDRTTAYKYIRQLTPDYVRLFKPGHILSEDIHWFQPEIFTKVDFLQHQEEWLPHISGERLKTLRKTYLAHNSSLPILKLTPQYSGKFFTNITLQMPKSKEDGPDSISMEGTQVSPSYIYPIFVNLPKEIKVIKSTEKIENGTLIHYAVEGLVNKQDTVELNLGDSKLKQVQFEPSVTLIMCQNGNTISAEDVPNLFDSFVCPFFSPPLGILEDNFSENEKPVVVQKILSSDRPQQIEGKGAGAALQKALREWGYAK